MRQQGDRASAWAALGVSILPGWLVLVGMMTTTASSDTSWWRDASLFVTGGLAILILTVGETTASRFERQGDKGRIPWLSAMASQLHVSKAQLSRSAAAAGIPGPAAIVAAWAPWWALFALWVTLAMFAGLDLL